MLAILNPLNAHNLSIFQPILMILVSKFMVHRALSDQTYLSIGFLSPLNYGESGVYFNSFNTYNRFKTGSPSNAWSPICDILFSDIILKSSKQV